MAVIQTVLAQPRLGFFGAELDTLGVHGKYLGIPGHLVDRLEPHPFAAYRAGSLVREIGAADSAHGYGLEAVTVIRHIDSILLNNNPYSRGFGIVAIL